MGEGEGEGGGGLERYRLDRAVQLRLRSCSAAWSIRLEGGCLALWLRGGLAEVGHTFLAKDGEAVDVLSTALAAAGVYFKG